MPAHCLLVGAEFVVCVKPASPPKPKTPSTRMREQQDRVSVCAHVCGQCISEIPVLHRHKSAEQRRQTRSLSLSLFVSLSVCHSVFVPVTQNTHTDTLTHSHSHTRTLSLTRTQTHSHTHTQTQTHSHTHAHGHTRTQTQTHSPVCVCVWLVVDVEGVPVRQPFHQAGQGRVARGQRDVRVDLCSRISNPQIVDVAGNDKRIAVLVLGMALG